jgi:gluconokinase
MAAGKPLTDDDRWDWLRTLNDACVSEFKSGHSAVVMPCSALKFKYREEIREVHSETDVQIHFLFLSVSEERLRERANARQGHFMKSNMITSQLSILEDASKEDDVIEIDANGSMEHTQKAALDEVNAIFQRESVLARASGQ